MKLIVDTSVVISVITNEQTKAKLIDITQGCQLYAPSSLSWEIGNAISAMYKRKSINKNDGLNILKEYQNIDISLVDIDIPEAIKIAHKYSIYAYDAYMMQCAKAQKATLTTLDKRLAEVSEKDGIKTIWVN